MLGKNNQDKKKIVFVISKLKIVSKILVETGKLNVQPDGHKRV